MIVMVSVAYYRCGRYTHAKLYLPVEYAGRISRQVKLLYQGLEHSVSASPPWKTGRGLKIYIPARIIRQVYDQSRNRPNTVLLEIDSREEVRILSFGWRCKICQQFTLEDDQLCWTHRIQVDGVCSRCGKLILEGRLCLECRSRIIKAYLGYLGEEAQASDNVS